MKGVVRSESGGSGQRPTFRWKIFLLVIALVIALLVIAGFLLGAALEYTIEKIFEPQVPEWSRREIEVLRRESILEFRAPGTKLLAMEERPAVEPLFRWGGQETSSVSQGFELSGDPGDAVEAYRAAAEASGWRLVFHGCSRTELATGAVFGKRLGRIDASLVVAGQLESDPDQPPLGRKQSRRVGVVLRPREPVAADLPVDAGLHRNDVHCLRDLDRSDPELSPPGPPPESLSQLCRRIPIPLVKAVAPAVEGFEMPSGQECWLTDSSGDPLFLVEFAGQPPAYYRDRLVESPTGASDLFLFSVYGAEDPDLARAVWVSTPSGPLTLATAGDYQSEEAERLLFPLARLLAGMPAPTTEQTTVAPPPDFDVLVEYRLEGGIAGTRWLIVTADGQAVYSPGPHAERRFPLPRATMEELRATLSGVEFELLSPLYGSRAGPDSQAEVVSYKGTTVRIFSDEPPELRPLTALLSRLLEEGSSL